MCSGLHILHGKAAVQMGVPDVEEQMQSLWLTDGRQWETKDSEPQGEIEEMKRKQASFQSVPSYELPVFSNWWKQSQLAPLLAFPWWLFSSNKACGFLSHFSSLVTVMLDAGVAVSFSLFLYHIYILRCAVLSCGCEPDCMPQSSFRILVL